MAATILRRAVFGFLLGMAIGNVITVLMSLASGEGALLFTDYLLARTGSEAGALLVQTLLSGVIGAAAMAGTVLYNLEPWGLLKSAIIHYAICMVTYIPIGIILGWIEPHPASIAVTAGALAIVYAAIWLIMNARYKSEVDELNNLLDKIERA